MKFKNRKDPNWLNHLIEKKILVEAITSLEGIVPIRCGKVSDDESLGSTVIPLNLAWAKSIHKSQGETYDRVIVKLPDVEFAKGLTLVALSRVRTAEGMIIQDVSQEALAEKVNAAHSKEIQYAYMDIRRFIGLQPKKLCL